MSEGRRFELPRTVFNWICILIVLYAFGSMIFSRSPFTEGNAVPPATLCQDSLRLDATGADDFSTSTKSYFDIDPDPSSTTQLCFGPLVSIPNKWTVFDGQFVDPNAANDGCVAWLQYWGIDRLYGPYYANRSLGENNKPNKWRIATNCRIRYYQRG